MYYDQGPLPSGDRPRQPGAMGPPRYTPGPVAPRPAPSYNGAVYTEAARERYQIPRQRKPVMGHGPLPQPAYGGMMQPQQAQQPPGPQFLRRYGAAGGGTPAALPWMQQQQQRDHLGNMPGDWDYRQPAYQQRPQYQMF